MSWSKAAPSACSERAGKAARICAGRARERDHVDSSEVKGGGAAVEKLITDLKIEKKRNSETGILCKQIRSLIFAYPNFFFLL